jgi:O-antigen ligase
MPDSSLLGSNMTTEGVPIKIKMPAMNDFYVVPIVRYAFYGFIATIPFETMDLGIPLLEPTAISLGLLLVSLVFQIPLCLRRPPLAFILYFAYLVIFAVSAFFTASSSIAGEANWQVMILAQLVVMSWVAYNVLKSERVAKNALLVLALSCTLLCILQQLGITTSKGNEGGKIERVTALGFHPNNYARILVLALLSIAGLAYAMKKSVFKSKVWVWGIVGILAIAIVQTGSRGGLLALGAGLGVFALKEGAVSTKIRNASMVFVGLMFFLALVMQSDISNQRFQNAMEDGDLARRDVIYPLAWKMIKQKPLTGWGVKTSEYELGARVGHPEEESKNPHNLILYVLISVGLVGAIPVFWGLYLTGLAAWRARAGSRGVLPLSLLITVLIANMSGVWLNNKMHWFVVAYVLASYSLYVRQKTAMPKIRIRTETPEKIQKMEQMTLPTT